MRRRTITLVITSFILLLVGSPAGAQAQTPTSFTGGPDVSSDVSTPNQPRQATDGSIAPRATDTGGEDNPSTVGVLLAFGAALAVVIVAVAVVGFARRGRERERVSAPV